MRNKKPIKPTDMVYISGPMTGLPDANRAAFDAAEQYLCKTYKCRVLNPAHMPDGLNYRQYMAHALQLLAHATVIVLLPGFEESLGVKVELNIADRDKVPILLLKQERLAEVPHGEQ